MPNPGFEALNSDPASLDRQRTTAITNAAIAKIKEFKLPATPPILEFWYLYACGDAPSLTQAVDDALARGKHISETECQRLLARFNGPESARERIAGNGALMHGAIGEVAEAVDEIRYSTQSYSSDIVTASRSLPLLTGLNDVKGIVAALTDAIADFKRINLELENRLGSAKDQIGQLRDDVKAIELEAQTDALTGLMNRRQLDCVLPQRIAQVHLPQKPLCLMLADIDHFREFNNRWGHLIGDQVLRLVASSFRSTFKGKDSVARFGGEEFAVIMPETTINAACSVAEQVRRAVASKHVQDRHSNVDMGRITISIGIAQARPDDTAKSLTERADACLYLAKDSGRNRIALETELTNYTT